MRRFFLFHELTEFRLYITREESIGDYGVCGEYRGEEDRLRGPDVREL